MNPAQDTAAEKAMDHRPDCQLLTVETYGLCTCDFDQRMKAMTSQNTAARTAIAEMQPWTPAIDMSRVSVSAPDKESGSPKRGDMIARNPVNHDDQWLVAAAYFAANFEPIQP